MTTSEVHSGRMSTPGVQRFRSRPVYIEAIQWFGRKNCRQVFDFLGWNHDEWDEDDDHEVIHLPFPGDRAFPGDWIYKEGDDFHACPDQIFSSQYQPVEAGEA